MTENAHPPRNRTEECLPVLVLRLQHAGGTLEFDPNGQILHLAGDPASILGLAPVPGLRSVISGDPALLYRCSDLAVPLTVWEYVGLVGLELKPQEFRALRDRYGDAFDWHDDFYDPETGEALQPRGLREGLIDLARELGALPAPPAP